MGSVLRWLWLLALLPAALLMWWLWHWLHHPAPGLALENGAQLQWQDCWFEKPLLRPVFCGRLRTAREDGQTPEHFSLPVVYVPPRIDERLLGQDDTPMVYVSGGPGGATGMDQQGIDYWLAWLDQVNWRSGTLLYDQRGVGLSQPLVDCPELLQTYRDLLPLGLDAEEEGRRVRDVAQQCRQRLLNEGWDLKRFTTRHNARDVIDLMASLGAEQWRLYGISYGTRVGLEVMRQQPAGLQAVILDSVYPPERSGEATEAWLVNRSLRLLVRTCELLPSCDLPPMRIENDLQQALAQLAKAPLSVQLRDPDNGAPLSVLFNARDLMWLIFNSQYLWHNVELLPAAISELARGHVSPAMRRMMQENIDSVLDASMSDAVASAVDCADNGEFSQQAAQAALQQFPAVAALKASDWSLGMCRFWVDEYLDDDFRQPVRSHLPVLLLAGEFDPVTPPQWAYAAGAFLPNSYTFTFPGIGHGALDSDACALEVVSSFLKQPQQPAVPACLALQLENR